jgi:hypothetical protein
MLHVTTAPPTPQAPPELPDVADEGDRPSITEVNGTVARFEMTYSPDAEDARIVFGPPLWSRLPAYLYGGLAAALVSTVAFAYTLASSNARVYVWIVEGDRHRPIPAAALAFVVACSGLATMIRAHMRGVIVTKHGLEARYLLPFGVPRVRRWAWSQLHRVVMDDRGVMLELWDSTYERLPDVAELRKLAGVLLHAAQKHGIVATQLGSIDDG